MSVALQLITGIVPSAVVIVVWFLDWFAKRHDEKADKDTIQSVHIEELKGSVERLGKIVNKLSDITMRNSNGIAYIIDGLEANKIMNGTGEQYLKDINEFYKQEGYSALRFNSIKE